MAIPPPPADPTRLGNSIPPPPDDPSRLNGSSDSGGLSSIPGQALEASLNNFAPGLGTLANSPYGEQFARGIALLPNSSNLPGTSFANSLGQSTPPALGGMLGAAAGAPAGPGGAIGGAALGGAAVRSVQNMASMAAGNIRPASQSLEDIGISGAVQGASEGIGQGLSALAGRYLVKPGAQVMRAAGGVPEKYGEAVLSGRVNLGNAPSSGEVANAYRTFEEGAGLQSPRLQRALSGQIVQSDSAALDAVQNAASQLTPFVDKGATSQAGRVVYDMDAIKAAADAGKLPPDLAQNLYNSSQGAQHLLNMGKAGSPKEIANTANISAAKDAFDQALETIAPGYADARRAAFQNAAKDAFSSFFPLNQNQSVNQLRGYSGLIGAATAPLTALATHSLYPLAGMALPLVTSPLMMGAAIRTAQNIAPAISLGARTLAQGTADSQLSPQAQAKMSPESISAFYRSPGDR